ncbi:MAG: AccI family restriction endonuclease [bacterium]|nr:AccI family restriction endonuclease [bacterium]
MPRQGPFDVALSVPTEDIEVELRGFTAVPWSGFLLNPRRLRGSDFLMRWSQGRWSEDRIIEATSATSESFALPYGPSSTAPNDDVREFELYFERLEMAGLGRLKRPDLLVFRETDRDGVADAVDALGGISELPFTPENNPRIREVLGHALLGVECENSLWVVKRMPDYGSALTPQRRLGGKLGLKKAAVLPTIILKEEDRHPLREWQAGSNIPIHIWHIFFDMAYGISLNRAEDLIGDGAIEPTVQIFQAPGGATTRKLIYKIYYQHAYLLGESEQEPRPVADYVMDRNGHVLPYVRFSGGKLTLHREALEVLRAAAAGSPRGCDG